MNSEEELILNPEPIDIPPPALRSLHSLIESVANFAQLRHECAAQGIPFGPVTPWNQVTEAWGGAIPQGLHTILGAPGAGKTAFALQLAAECQCPCLFVTCEMTPEELVRRLAARFTRTTLKQFKDGSLSGDMVRKKVELTLEECPELYIANGMQEYISPELIENFAEQIRKDNDHLLIVIDSMHSWVQSDTRPSSATSEYDRLNAAVGQLLTIAANLKCPVIAITERNRASFARHASEEKLHAGAGSRKLEYSPESVLNLELKKSDKVRDFDKDVTLTFEKNRNGGKGIPIELIFQGGYQCFKENTYE